MSSEAAAQIRIRFDWVLLVPDILVWGSERKRGVVLLHLQEEAFSVPEGLAESGPGVAQLWLQGSVLQTTGIGW